MHPQLLHFSSGLHCAHAGIMGIPFHRSPLMYLCCWIQDLPWKRSKGFDAPCNFIKHGVTRASSHLFLLLNLSWEHPFPSLHSYGTFLICFSPTWMTKWKWLAYCQHGTIVQQLLYWGLDTALQTLQWTRTSRAMVSGTQKAGILKNNFQNIRRQPWNLLQVPWECLYGWASPGLNKTYHVQLLRAHVDI